jgi:hypothetical protein
MVEILFTALPVAQLGFFSQSHKGRVKSYKSFQISGLETVQVWPDVAGRLRE